VGSLPHHHPQEAAELSLTLCPQLPFVPTLPSRSPYEGMLAQGLVGVRGIEIGEGGRLIVDRRRVDPLAAIRTDLEHEAFASLRAFAAAASGRQGPIKWQLTGPITLGLALVREGVLASEAFDVAGRAVLLRLRTVHHFLGEALPACPQVVIVDEPGMTALLHPGFPLPPDTAIDLVSMALAAVESTAMVGVHHCGEGDWAAILASGPGILSVPARPDLLTVAGYLGAFLDAGGWIAWGVVRTDQPVAGSADRYWRELAELWCQLVQAGCNPTRLRQQAIVTPACGLAGHSEAQAKRVLRLVDDVAERVRAQAVATRLAVGA